MTRYTYTNGRMTSTTYKSGTSQVYKVTDPAGTVQATYAYDSAGRVATVTNGDGKVTRYDYNNRGQKLHVWGDATYPVEYVYDSQGRQSEMKTYKDATTTNATAWSSVTTGPAAVTNPDISRVFE